MVNMILQRVLPRRFDTLTKIGKVILQNKFQQGCGCKPLVIMRGLRMSETMDHDLNIVVKNGIRTITMNRPSKFNAVTIKMMKTISASLLDSNKDDQTKIVVITGTGNKAFTGGVDLIDMIEAYKKPSPPPTEAGIGLIIALIECRKPIVALVNGSAVGLGVVLLPFCETVYATDKAMFSTPFIRFGIPPEACASYLFPKIVGHAKAGELLNSEVSFTAEEAYLSGLVTRTFPDATFLSESSKRVEEMADNSLQSLVNSKELLRGRERELLLKVHWAEHALFNVEIIRANAEKFLSSRKK